MHAVVLGELVRESARADRTPTEEELPFVDRERERAVLAASVAPVRMGFGTLVELVGEPGIGKSRLAGELRENCARHAADLAPLRAVRDVHAVLRLPPVPSLAPRRRAQRRRRAQPRGARRTTRLGRRGAGSLGSAPRSTTRRRCRDDARGGRPRALLPPCAPPRRRRFAARRDARLADPARAARTSTGWTTRPPSCCATWAPSYRHDPGSRVRPGGPSEAASRPPRVRRRSPLSPCGSSRFPRTTRGRSCGRRRAIDDSTEDDLAALMERGAGNPLFLQELASRDRAQEAAEQMPDTVETLVATRIDGLAPGDRALLRWASVLGASFSGALIADVLEGDSTAASDSEAWDRLGEFVERDPDVAGAFRFRHALIRDGAYEGLSYRRRRELHARVAAVLEVRTPDAVELLSLHFSEPTTSLRRGGTPSRPGGAHRRSGPTSKRRSSTSARSRSPPRSPSSSRPRSRRSRRRSATSASLPESSSPPERRS